MDSGKQKSRQTNPMKEANFCSLALFGYMFSLLKKGYYNEITEEDLWCPLDDHKSEFMATRLEKYWQEEQIRAKTKNIKPRLYIGLFKTFKSQLLWMIAVILVFEMTTRIGQPLVLGTLLRYFQHNSDPTADAVNSAIGFCLLVFAYSCYNAHYLHYGFNLGVQVKASLCSVVYRKALRLSYAALGKSSPGQMVNLLSNDVSRFDFLFRLHNFVWLGPLFLLAISNVTWLQSGWPGLIGISTIVISSIPHVWLGRLTTAYRKLVAKKSDERLRMMEEIISGVRIIKMYAWEKPFTALISSIRREELKEIKKTSYIRGFFMSFMLTNPRIACYSALISMAYIGDELTAEKVFVYAVISQSVSFVTGVFVRGLTEGLEALVAVNRIEKFLLLEERDEKYLTHIKRTDSTDGLGHAIIMKNADAKWDKSCKEETLANVNVQLKKGSLTALIGPVGSGKSSLLYAILGELPVTAGWCRKEGDISFACQEPWMFPATVRQNIIFGRPYDDKHYNAVVRACALLSDFQQLANGDASIIGDKGCLLSGGQKARINLARALYREADVYLLDDPLSAVDTHVGQHLFDECVMDFLRGKTRVLVTHQLQYLHNADHIIVMNNGRIEIQGTFLEITASELDYARFLEKGESSDDTSGDETDDSIGITGHAKDMPRKSRVSHKSFGSSEFDSQKHDNSVQNFAESSSKGTMHRSVYLEYFLCGPNKLALFSMIFTVVFSQISASCTDYWMSYWVRTNENLRYSDMSSAYTTSPSEENNNSTSAGVDVGSDTPISEERAAATEFCIYIYSALIASTIILSLLKILAFYSLSLKCSRDLYNQMFNSVIKTYIKFFDVNPTGRVMNRFSKDVGTVDEQLPKSMFDSAQYLLIVLGALTISVIMNYWFLFILAGLSAVFFILRKVYMKTSKDLKRLEGINKSPVFVHLNATLQGLSTIRASNGQNILMEEFDRHEDLYSSTCYVFNATCYTYICYVDLLLSLFITAVTSGLLLGGDNSGAKAGFALSQLVSITSFLQVGLKQSSEVENHMMAVERMAEYKYLDMEPNLETTPHNQAPANWPAKGEIKMKDMSLTYTTNGAPVLKNINVTINAGEKVGIVGRTGAGKSSLISALFRLTNVEGTILIDGHDTKDFSLHDIRKNISIIPQDPFLFSGTMRKNLDPFSEYKDEEIWQALENVEMKECLSDTTGLDTKVADKGSNFSVGQKQLLCLARAILKQNKILVLDEATANVDPKTDMLIQKTIRAKFAAYTVLTVAHRLQTVMDSDKIMVMERGDLVEFDHPYKLLQNTQGMFYKLVYRTGQIDQLSRIAFQSYSR